MPDGDIHIQQGIGKLAKALAAAQGEIQPASKDAKNPGFKRADGKVSKYADLTAVWDACRAALAKNEIAVIQAPEVYEGKLILHTTLAHSSGEQISGTFPVTPVQNTPQGIGSAMTYARRYSLASMVGVAPEGDDDDGNAGSAGTLTNGATKDTSPPAQVKKSALPPEPSDAVKKAVTKWVDEQITALGEVTSMDALLAWENEADDKGESNLRKMDRITGSVYPLQGNRLKGEYLRLATELNPANG